MMNVIMRPIDYGYSLLLACPVLGPGSNPGNTNLRGGILYEDRSTFCVVPGIHQLRLVLIRDSRDLARYLYYQSCPFT